MEKPEEQGTEQTAQPQAAPRNTLASSLGIEQAVETLRQSGQPLPELPGYRTQQFIKKYGTPEQQQNLLILQRLYNVLDQPAMSAELERYNARFVAGYKPDQATAAIQGRTLMEKFYNFMDEQVAADVLERPEEVNYELTRRLFWRAYALLIAERKGVEPVIDGNMGEVLKNFCHWLIGSKDGEWEVTKGVYLWGEYGTGKSVILEAGRIVLEFYAKHMRWRARRAVYTNMDEFYAALQAKEEGANLKRFVAGHHLIDEIKQKHFRYKDYGNDIDLVPDVFTLRYQAWREGRLTVFTSNMSVEQLIDQLFKSMEEMEAERVASRLVEMVQVVKIYGTNKRDIKMIGND